MAGPLAPKPKTAFGGSTAPAPAKIVSPLPDSAGQPDNSPVHGVQDSVQEQNPQEGAQLPPTNGAWVAMKQAQVTAQQVSLVTAAKLDNQQILKPKALHKPAKIDEAVPIQPKGYTPEQPAPGVARDEAVAKIVTTTHGTRPHVFGGALSGDSDREREFLGALPNVAKHLNQVAQSKGAPFQFTEAELATNFVTEGGFYLLQDEMNGLDGTPVEPPRWRIDGFEYLGIDTFMSRRQALAPWLSQDLLAWSADTFNTVEHINEHGETVKSLELRDIAQSAEANAVMFADARAAFSHDCVAMKLDPSHLTPEAWFFWTTIYFNAGPGKGRETLKREGVNAWKVPWPHGDKAKYTSSVLYNGHSRTASWDYLRRTQGDHLDHVAGTTALPPVRQ